MFEWIISSTVLTAVIIALRFVLKGKISPRLQYALWALVLIRLLLPFSIGSSSLSVMNQVEYSSTYQEMTSTVTVITPGNTLPGQPAGNNTAPPLSGTQSPAVTVPGTTPSAGQTAPEQPTSPPAQEAPTPQVDESSGIWTLLRLVWLGGSILLGVWFAMTNLLFFLRIKKSRTPDPFSCKLPVYVCGAVDTPCLFGFFRPAVYLTEDVASDERTTRHAVEHEMTHYYHKDHIWAVLRCVCLAVHWFNPLVWYAAFLSRNDAELACDDSTIRRLGESERAEYGRTLLRLTCEKRTAILHTATTMTGSGRSIKERIALIVKRPKMAVYTLIAVLLIAAVAIVCTFTGAKDKSNETNTQLWPEDAIISCARFEYAGDNGGYKLITSEIAQFNSLRSMNLIPVEGEFTGDIIYRLILNWNEVSKGAKAYIILVSEESLSVNGQLFQPDGFDFSEILAYFEGKYEYFEYNLLYDTEQDNSGDSNAEQNQPTDEQIRANAIVKNFASLKAEDIKQIPGFIGTDYSDVAVLLNDLEEYMVEPFESDQSFWSLTLYLSGGPEEFNHRTDENLTIYAYGEESRLQIQYHSKLGVSTRIYFDYPALHQYIRQQYHTDHVIDEEALALYRDIVTARAEYTMDVRNSNYDEAKFIGYEVMTFHQIGTFERDGMAYEVYELEIAFITDNTDYPWAMNRVWVDSELHIRSYDSYPYLVVRSNGTKTEHNFFPWDTYLGGTDFERELTYDEIAANFVPENSNGAYSIYTADNCSIALPSEWNMLLVNPAESFYLSDQTLFAVFHEGEYLSLGLGWIFSIQRYTEEEFLPLYLNSPSRQYVFAKDDSYYYCVLLPSDVQSEHPGISAFMEDIRTNKLSPILSDMIERNGWESFSSETAVETLPVLTLSAEETNALCTAALNDLKTGWWKGGELVDCTYEAAAFECVYRETIDAFDQFYGYAGYFRFDESGNCVEYWYAPSIVTIDKDTKAAHNVWWPGDGAYYESDILNKFPAEIAEIVAEPNTERAQMIRDRLMAIAKAQISQVTEADAATRLANLTVGDIKYIAGFSEVDASEIASLLSAAAGKMIERTEDVMSFWSLELYLSGGPDVYNTGTDEWLTIHAGLEENIVQINHHSKNGKYTILYFEDEALYRFVRGSYTTDKFIDEEAFGRFGDILEDRAQETVDRSKEYEGGYPLPYTGFKIVGFEKVDSFERDGTKYEVYEWDVAFLHDDPMKVGWAGGMWLDSELRVRALEQETYFVVRISGDVVEYDFFFWDLYFGPDKATGRENAIDAIIKRFSDLEN